MLFWILVQYHINVFPVMRFSRSQQRLEDRRVLQNESDQTSSRGWTKAPRRWVVFKLNGSGGSFIIDTLAWFQPGRQCQRKFIELRACIPETFTSRTWYQFVFVGQAILHRLVLRTFASSREKRSSCILLCAHIAYRVFVSWNPRAHFCESSSSKSIEHKRSTSMICVNAEAAS